MNLQNTVTAVGIAIVVILSLYFTSSTPTIVDQRLLIDLTDSLMSKPDARQLASLYDFLNNPWNGGTFHAKSITDVNYNKAYAVEIPTADFSKRLLSNEIERQRMVEKFLSRQASILDTILKEKVGRSHSSVYRVIAGELNELSEKDISHQKVLIIYGDIRENSEFLNLYKASNMSLLKSDPDSIISLFRKQVPLRNLTGIQVYLIYQPHSYYDDEAYRLISDVYKRMLEEKGAVVVVAANLTT